MINLNNLKTGRKLALGFGATALMMVVGTVLALYCTITINHDMQAAMQEAAMMNRTKDIDTELDTLYLEMWGLVSAKDTAKRQASLAAVESHRQQYRKHLDELKAAEKSEPGQRLLDRLEQALVGARDANQRITDLVLKSEGQNLKVLEQFEAETARQMQDKIDPALEAILEWRQQRLDELQAHAQGTVQRAEWFLLAGLVVGLGCALALGWLITRSIVVPIHEAVRLTDRLAQGDFSAEVSAASRARGDEMGDLARAFQLMVENTRQLLQEVAAGVQTLASSSTEFTAVASQTAHAVRTMSEKTASVAAAAEEASANTTSVAASMEQAAANLSSVASATEEMSATVGEIAANSEKARAISEQATAQAQTISALMQQLGQAAREIGKVTETITDISSQTNLLALNATIEAARAGAAGKGFAVVANEIKELARQTAAATEDIKAKISGMQTSTGSAITDIEKISGVIQEVSAIVASIAASIEEQATVTKDVAANIAQASAGVNDSNERVAQTASVSKDIARDMAGVNVAVGDIREGGEQLSASTAELSKLAEQLKETADHFQV